MLIKRTKQVRCSQLICLNKLGASFFVLDLASDSKLAELLKGVKIQQIVIFFTVKWQKAAEMAGIFSRQGQSYSRISEN